MDFYEINNETIALVPLDLYRTKIYETDKILYLNIPVMKIIKDSCNSFGSSYEGRHAGTKKLIGISHKSPIIIEESRNIIYFPTTSPKLDNCCWLSLKHIKKYEKSHRKTSILFENGQKIEVDVSIGSFDNQYLHAMKLDMALRKNILNLE